MSKKRNIIISCLLTILSIVYIFLVKTVDVKGIGPNNSKVGFSSLNSSFRDLIGYNKIIYVITEALGILTFLLVLMYALIGLYQLIKRKNIFKVDKKILLVGCFYVVVLALYVLFDKLAINYRPILTDGKLEASFPSSHTMLALCVCGSSLIISKHFINKKYVKGFNIITIILMLLVTFGRLFSGVHWISDIIGGIIISGTLLMYFYTIYDEIK